MRCGSLIDIKPVCQFQQWNDIALEQFAGDQLGRPAFPRDGRVAGYAAPRTQRPGKAAAIRRDRSTSQAQPPAHGQRPRFAHTRPSATAIKCRRWRGAAFRHGSRERVKLIAETLREPAPNILKSDLANLVPRIHLGPQATRMPFACRAPCSAHWAGFDSNPANSALWSSTHDLERLHRLAAAAARSPSSLMCFKK